MKEHPHPLLNHPVDAGRDFHRLENTLFLPENLENFSASRRRAIIRWRRYAYKVRTAFNQEGLQLVENPPWEFPAEYGGETFPLPLQLSFFGPRTIRLRFAGRKKKPALPEKSLMLLSKAKPAPGWRLRETPAGFRYESPAGALFIRKKPFALELHDSSGKLLTKTFHLNDNRSLRNTDPLPFCFVRNTPDYLERFCATFSLSPGEKIYGCGESFTRLDKRGQKIVLWAYDAHGVQHDGMYKPVPFFFTNRGYGMFVHTSAPVTFDFGASYGEAASLFTFGGELDLFLFVGSPKDILSSYTALTGKSPMVPVWSLGLWMSRCTYKSEKEVRSIAKKFREKDIPCDVLHLDTGWFEKDWRCDFRFSKTRFANPKRMIRDLKRLGLRVTLWQLPYFTPTNPLFNELVQKKYAVTDAQGNLPTEDAILDFSNPKTVRWYQKKLASLFSLGVSAIKVDFGEAAPLHGVFASGRTGLFEHNLYPLRYNQAAGEITRRKTGFPFIWARSAWAGSQRYPVHWGGDAEPTYSAMAATLRGGLSIGLCGFTFWSHDIGGFSRRPEPHLYLRWLFFGLFSSHSRCHGIGPREPWTYGGDFEKTFRELVQWRYRLLPYIYTQALESSRLGFPLLRPLFFEYPQDPACWLIEDEYLFGRDLLAAPLFHDGNERSVYLPPGEWVEVQNKKRYTGEKWHTIGASPLPGLLFARAGTLLPRVKSAASTRFIDWKHIELQVFAAKERKAEGLLALPGQNRSWKLCAEKKAKWTLRPPYPKGVDFQFTEAEAAY